MTRTRAPMVVKQQECGAGDARMQHVAADRDRQALDAPLLRRMVSASSSAWSDARGRRRRR